MCRSRNFWTGTGIFEENISEVGWTWEVGKTTNNLLILIKTHPEMLTEPIITRKCSTQVLASPVTDNRSVVINSSNLPIFWFISIVAKSALQIRGYLFMNLYKWLIVFGFY